MSADKNKEEREHSLQPWIIKKRQKSRARVCVYCSCFSSHPQCCTLRSSIIRQRVRLSVVLKQHVPRLTSLMLENINAIKQFIPHLPPSIRSKWLTLKTQPEQQRTEKCASHGCFCPAEQYFEALICFSYEAVQNIVTCCYKACLYLQNVVWRLNVVLRSVGMSPDSDQVPFVTAWASLWGYLTAAPQSVDRKVQQQMSINI